MANNLKLGNAVRNAAWEGGISDEHFASSFISLYDGSQPTNPDTSIGSVNNYCSVVPPTLAASEPGTVSNGVFTAGTIIDGRASLDGAPVWFRHWASNGTTGLVDGTVGMFTSWLAETAYTLGKIVAPASPNGRYYQCTTAGTTGSSAPTWPTSLGGTVTDGDAVWTDIGTKPYDMMLGVSALAVNMRIALSGTYTVPVSA